LGRDTDLGEKGGILAPPGAFIKSETETTREMPRKIQRGLWGEETRPAEKEKREVEKVS